MIYEYRAVLDNYLEKTNQPLHCKCVFVYYRTDMFRLFLSHYQGACYMVQLFILVFFGFNSPFVKIINKIFKMFCCLTLFCVSRDGWLSPQPAVTRCKTIKYFYYFLYNFNKW